MHEDEPHYGATPGIVGPNLAMEPLGTSGELSPGPDDLRPEIPEERAELVRRGYMLKPDEEIEAERQSLGFFGGEWDDFDAPIFETPDVVDDAPLARMIDGPLFEE